MKILLIDLVVISVCMIAVSPTLYSVLPNFTVAYERSYEELAYATYQEYSYEKGWNYLSVHANERKSLVDQHRGAGFLEGYITYRDIYSAYRNLCGSIIKGQQLSVKVQNFIDEQLQYIDTMVENHPRELYWQYAGAYLEQLRYMYRGYLTRINIEKKLIMYIGFSQFYYLTNTGDLEDLIPAFDETHQPNSEVTQKNQKMGNCNAYVKMMDSKIYVAHSTHNIYQFMLRIFKTYHFPSRDPNIGSQWFTFSSRPGDLISKDDFYVLSSGLIVMQTSFNNYNKDNYKDLTPRTVPCWLRATIAVNLARSGSEWVDYFLKLRSGTHNNQWVIVDPAKVSTLKDLVIFVQEAFSAYNVTDMTKILIENSYVGSYNVPYNLKICNKLAYPDCQHAYDEDPRAYEFRKYDKLISNTEDMKKWLIMNENKDPRIGLAPRYDLADKNAKPFGLTDCKIATPETLKDGFIWAISGPTTSNGRFQPFSWNNWPNNSHEGMPIKWNFTWEKYPIRINESSTKLPNQ